MSALEGSPKTLEQLLADLKQAGEALEKAREDAKVASHRETDATNVFNGIAKEVDMAMEKIKKTAPHGTNWSEGRRM